KFRMMLTIFPGTPWCRRRSLTYFRLSNLTLLFTCLLTSVYTACALDFFVLVRL
ncbi:hypothetical protein EWB00_007405, partial [Schistosoma japonicum]